MYEYFGVGPQVLEDVGDMYPRFLLWLPKYHLSKPLKRSLQVWRMVIDNLAADDVSFFFFFLASFHYRFFVVFKCLWILAECEWAQELNGPQVLFDCGHGRYWYLGDRVLAQV